MAVGSGCVEGRLSSASQILDPLGIALRWTPQPSAMPESNGSTCSEGERFDVPKGTAIEDGDYHVFTSEDGSLTVKVPRTDLVMPSVQDTYAGGVYTYVVANSATAKQPIKIVRIVPNTNTVTEVSNDPRFKLIRFGW